MFVPFAAQLNGSFVVHPVSASSALPHRLKNGLIIQGGLNSLYFLGVSCFALLCICFPTARACSYGMTATTARSSHSLLPSTVDTRRHLPPAEHGRRSVKLWKVRPFAFTFVLVELRSFLNQSRYSSKIRTHSTGTTQRRGISVFGTHPSAVPLIEWIGSRSFPSSPISDSFRRCLPFFELASTSDYRRRNSRLGRGEGSISSSSTACCCSCC